MEVFLFYRTDNWNSCESKDLVYIGTNREASIKKLMKLESEPITEEQAEDIRRMNQSQCNNVGYDYMLAHASGIIAYYDGKPKGGTFYTCRKARLKGLDIINLYR